MKCEYEHGAETVIGHWAETVFFLMPRIADIGGVAQMVERSLSMREVPGSMPGASRAISFILLAPPSARTLQYWDTGRFPRKRWRRVHHFGAGGYAILPTAHQNSIVGSVVECSPATRAARVRFPDDAVAVSFGQIFASGQCCEGKAVRKTASGLVKRCSFAPGWARTTNLSVNSRTR